MPRTNWHDVKGLEELQRYNAAIIRAVKPTGALGRNVKSATQRSYRFLRDNIHVDTGAARSSIRMSFRETKNTATGDVYFDPNARNPRGSRSRGRRGGAKRYRKVVDYIGYEFARGGAHDTWGKMLQDAEQAAKNIADVTVEDLKRA